jgi:hypothetical protein
MVTVVVYTPAGKPLELAVTANDSVLPLATGVVMEKPSAVDDRAAVPRV